MELIWLCRFVVGFLDFVLEGDAGGSTGRRLSEYRLALQTCQHWLEFSQFLVDEQDGTQGILLH